MSGLEKFSGTLIHSHSYRSAEPYKNKRVVIVGAGPSGVDIAKLVSKVAAKVLSNTQVLHHKKMIIIFVGLHQFPRSDVWWAGQTCGSEAANISG